MLALVVTFAALAPCGESQSLAREPVVLQHVTTGEAEPELHAVVSIRIDGELVSAGEVLLAAVAGASARGHGVTEALKGGVAALEDFVLTLDLLHLT